MMLNRYTTGTVTSGMTGVHLVQRNEGGSVGQP
jgi:hypothetical protein